MRPTIRPRGLAVFLLANVAVILAVVAIMRPDVAHSYVSRTIGRGDAPVALLRIDQDTANPFREGRTDPLAADATLQTTLQLIRSPSVLAAVAADPRIASMDLLRNASDPEAAIRDRLVVRPKFGTTLVEVTARGLDRDDGAVVVNAVVEAFIEVRSDWADAKSRRSIEKFEAYLGEVEAKLKSQTEELRALERLPLEPGGPEVDRAEVEEDLRDCLRQLRRVRIDRAGLLGHREAAGAEGDSGAREPEAALKAVDRQEAHLVADRDRLAAAIAEHDASAAARRALSAELEYAEQVARTMRARLDQLRFDSQGGITVISRATP